jgi:cytochrome c-type biogenesis protein CcmE
MNKKYIFGGVIVTIFLILMIVLFTQSNIKYESDFTNVISKQKTVKATGSWVKERSYEINKEKNLFSFYLADEKGTMMKVVYHGTIPNNFESAKSVVVTGKYEDGYFNARDILTKCPSKYQEEKVKTSGL